MKLKLNILSIYYCPFIHEDGYVQLRLILLYMYVFRPSVKKYIVMPLYLYNLTILVVTHIKTRRTDLAKEVNSGLAMNSLFNLTFILAVPFLFVPRIYAR